MRARDHRLPLRTWVLCLGILGLWAQGSQVGHMLLVEHVVCAEHGELVHGDAAHGAEANWASGPSSELAFFPSPRAEEAHAHEHCASLSERRAAVSSSTEASLAFEPGQAAALELPAAPAPHSSESRLRLAPKASPPAC